MTKITLDRKDWEAVVKCLAEVIQHRWWQSQDQMYSPTGRRRKHEEAGRLACIMRHIQHDMSTDTK